MALIESKQEPKKVTYEELKNDEIKKYAQWEVDQRNRVAEYQQKKYPKKNYDRTPLTIEGSLFYTNGVFADRKSDVCVCEKCGHILA